MDNNSIYPNQSQGTTPQAQPYQQQVYTQPVYQQPVQQPVQQQSAYSYNTPVTPQAPLGTKCPGKEIAGLVMGIGSLVEGVAAAICGMIPVYGIIYAIIFGLFGLGLGIAAIILHKKVHEQATVITNKIEIARKLAIPGIITSGAGMVLSILITTIVCAAGLAAVSGASGLESLIDSFDYYY